MGKVADSATTTASAAEMNNKRRKKKKKCGAPNPPSQSDPPNRNFTNPTHRSNRRNPTPNSLSPASEFVSDEDDERKEKKVKLVVRLPQLNQQQHFHHSSSSPPHPNSGSNSDPDGDNTNPSVKKRKINAVNHRSDDVIQDQDWKATDTLHGSPLESGPTTPLPDKKLMVFILDRLQKKDTYGVFSEAVDPNELPDYHEIIEHPMDFGTVRKKLDQGLYLNVEDLEADVFLICSNAMQYNAPDTIYFRQARTIQELAKRDFENLKQEGDDGEPQPKIVRRGRPPSKHMKKSLVSPAVDRVGTELSSGATLASPEDHASVSNSYNLRRPMLNRFRYTDSLAPSLGHCSSENYSEWLSNWNDEFPASILKADMKYGKKQFSLDENRRDTYKQSNLLALGHEPPALSYLGGGVQQLMAVGLHSEHGYARSLARFAATLGPVVWKVASKKIESVLPAGLKFGPGWVGENEASLQPMSCPSDEQKSATNLPCDGHPSRPMTPSTRGINSVTAYRSALQGREDMVEAASRVNSQNELAELRNAFCGIRPGPALQTRQQSLLHPVRNGISGIVGYGLLTETGMARPSMLTGQSGLEEALESSQSIGMVSRSDTTPTHPAPTKLEQAGCILEGSDGLRSGNVLALDADPTSSHSIPEMGLPGKPSLQVFSSYHRQGSLPVQPDLNVRLQAPSSPSSSLQIGSPHQPDLALQL